MSARSAQRANLRRKIYVCKFSGILQFVFRENDSLKILSVQKFLGVRDLFSKRSCVRPSSLVPRPPSPRSSPRSSGGDGEVKIEHILGEKQLNGKCGLYAEVTIEPGSSLGFHEHHGESETYYIISGKGEYDDDGVKRTVSAGDMTFTPDGHGHGLKCLGDEPVVFMALIIFD